MGAARADGRTSLGAALWLGLALVGCTSYRILGPEADPARLDRSEGILVLHVETEVPVHRLYPGLVPITVSFEPGEHFVLLAAPSGGYRWQQMVQSGQHYKVIYTFPDDLKELSFRVEPGEINYPGTLLLEHGSGGLQVRNLNRSAQALEKLQEVRPGLLSALPLRYSGERPDPFLRHYQSASAEGGSETEEAP